MTTYLIDYENTSHHGLAGFKKLTDDDTVVVFIGAKDATSSLPIDVVRELTAQGERPRLIWKRSKKTSKNYLDLQLVSYLGYLIGNTEISATDYVIVSKDRDFEAAIDFWAERRKEISISLRPTISVAVPAVAPATPTRPKATQSVTSESTKRAVRAAVKSLGLQPSDYTAIYRALAASRSPQELHSNLAQSIKSQGQKVYPLVKDIHSQLATPTVGNAHQKG